MIWTDEAAIARDDLAFTLEECGLKNTKKDNAENDEENLSEIGIVKTEQKEAWALIAARLGSKNNRTKFISNFWYSKKDKEQKPERITEKGLLDILGEMAGDESLDWIESVERFNKALQAEKRLRDERSNFCKAFTERANLQEEINQAKNRRNEFLSVLENLRQKLEAENKKIIQRIEETKLANIRRREHKEFEPSFIQIIFTLGRALREWREKDKNLANAIDISERNL